MLHWDTRFVPAIVDLKRCTTLQIRESALSSGWDVPVVITMVSENTSHSNFWKHNKDMPCDAARKARNTEQLVH
jgi:hypothetical protein